MKTGLNKKERREQRHERNKTLDKEYKESAWDRGKFIEPNHNNGPYPADYSIEVGTRLHSLMKQFISAAMSRDDWSKEQKNEDILIKFRLYRQRIRDFILHFNPEIPKTEEYWYFVNAYEVYQDNPENLINAL